LLAIAVILPDMTIYLMFIIPIKMKFVGIFYGLGIVFSFLLSDTVDRVVIVASLLNFIIFFMAVYRKPALSPKQIKRKAAYRGEMKKVLYTGGHKCAICGVTDKSAPEREFRYCSKCQGNYEYCDEHLYTHAHVVKVEKGEGNDSGT
jgi:hypothetical protein